METGSYIDGKWIHPKSNRLVRNVNPADPDDVIAEFPAALAEDVQRAIDAAQAAFRSWKNTPGPERGRVLWRAADIARRRADEIARTLTREEGKILKEAKGEVMKGSRYWNSTPEKAFVCTAKPYLRKRAILSPTRFAGRSAWWVSSRPGIFPGRSRCGNPHPRWRRGIASFSNRLSLRRLRPRC